MSSAGSVNGSTVYLALPQLNTFFPAKSLVPTLYTAHTTSSQHSPHSLFCSDWFVHPVEERAAFPVAIDGTGKESPWLPVSIVPLKHQSGTWKMYGTITV